MSQRLIYCYQRYEDLPRPLMNSITIIVVLAMRDCFRAGVIDGLAAMRCPRELPRRDHPRCEGLVRLAGAPTDHGGPFCRSDHRGGNLTRAR